MKKLRKPLTVICAIVISIACIPMTSCAVHLDVFEENYIEWYSESGVCGFTSTLTDDSAYGYFTINGIRVRAYYTVTYNASLNITFPYSDNLNIVTESGGMSYNISYGECRGIVEGSRNGDTFHVTSFKVGFTDLGAFDLYSRKVDPSIVDARDYTHCTWTANNGWLTIENYMYGVDEYLATIVIGGENKSIYFKWLDNHCFEIYDNMRSEKERKMLASGTYTNIATELSLTFKEDSAFGLDGQTVNLSGTVD